MQNGAQVKLCGVVSREIEVKTTPEGYQYGVIELSVDKMTGISKETRKPVYNSRRYKAYIWNKQVITNILPALEVGRKITLSGDLDLIPASSAQKGVKAIITVTKPTGISVIEEGKEVEIEVSSIECDSVNKEAMA